MTMQATTQKAQTTTRRSALLLGIGVGVALAGVVALGGTAQQADAASPEKIVFVSERTTGKGVNNPTGDAEIFRMSPNGTGVRQLTFNEVFDTAPHITPDSQKVVYMSRDSQPSNPEGDDEVYVMNAADGSNQTNLSNTGWANGDRGPAFSPDGQRIVYTSDGPQPSNPEGDEEVYVMNADGSGQRNLTNSGLEVYDYSYYARFSPDGQRVIYASGGVQTSNPEGDQELYAMNVSDGSAKKNLTNNGSGVGEWYGVFSPDGQKVLYMSTGAQVSNPEGESDLYVMNAQDGSAKKNLTNNTARDFYAEWGR
jgi:TolB protein